MALCVAQRLFRLRVLLFSVAFIATFDRLAAGKDKAQDEEEQAQAQHTDKTVIETKAVWMNYAAAQTGSIVQNRASRNGHFTRPGR